MVWGTRRKVGVGSLNRRTSLLTDDVAALATGFSHSSQPA